MSVEDKVRQNTARIIGLEGDVNQLKLDTSKLQLTLEHQEDRQKERFNTLCTSQIELKDIMKNRVEADERRAEEARKYRADREKQEADAQLQKQKWVQSLLTPQTLVVILVILAGLFGVKGIDMLSATGVPVQDNPPPTGSIP
mgnify:FL=1|tara:strand:- start:234 stop:662 length:429 start_codon:yes stop_codon:yes gene_type:complete